MKNRLNRYFWIKKYYVDQKLWYVPEHVGFYLWAKTCPYYLKLYHLLHMMYHIIIFKPILIITIDNPCKRDDVDEKRLWRASTLTLYCHRSIGRLITDRTVMSLLTSYSPFTVDFEIIYNSPTCLTFSHTVYYFSNMIYLFN